MKNENLSLESIGAGVHIYSSDQHPFGTDAILLADFASPKKSDRAVDLGSGNGIIPFLWARKDYPQDISAVELQENGVELIKKSIIENDFGSRIKVYCCDLREIESSIKDKYSYSLATMNPPYKPVNTGLRSVDESQKIARHQLTCTTKDLASCADKLLKFGGRLCICQRPEVLCEIIIAMKEKNFEAKKIRFVSDKSGKEPWLFLAEFRKGGKTGLRIIPELHIRNSDGTWSNEMLEIYGEYGDGTK